jgi:hypothetical protein
MMNAAATIDRAPRQTQREPLAPERLAIPAPHRGDLLEELAAYTASVHASSERSDLARLAGSIATGEVPGTLQAPLARLLDLSLSTGRARRLHGPEAEGAFLDLYRRTPAGLDLARRAREAETALGALVGTTLTGISIAGGKPGRVRIELSTSVARLTLDVDRSGVSVESVAVEL